MKLTWNSNFLNEKFALYCSSILYNMLFCATHNANSSSWSKYSRQLLLMIFLGTVLCISVGPRPKRVETRVILAIQEPLTTFHGIKQKKYFFFEKKIQNGQLKKTSFCQTVNSQCFFAKLNGIGPWISRIDWCEGHWFGSTHMAVRLSDIRPKTGKKWIFGVF